MRSKVLLLRGTAETPLILHFGASDRARENYVAGEQVLVLIESLLGN